MSEFVPSRSIVVGDTISRGRRAPRDKPSVYQRSMKRPARHAERDGYLRDSDVLSALSRQRFVTLQILWLFWSALASSAFARELLTFDGPLKDQFTPLSLSRLEAWNPDEAKSDDHNPQPRGRAVRVTAPAGGGFVTNADVVTVEWPKVESLGLWLYRTAVEAKEHPTVELELRLLEADRKAYFWRRIEIAHVGWQKLLLPLDWFVWSEGRIPRWDKVKYVGFRLRDEGSFTIDTLWTEPSAMLRTEFTPTELMSRVAFPKPLIFAAEEKPAGAAVPTTAPSSLRTLETRDVQLLTNAKSLELERLAAHCGLVAKQVRSELPFLAEPTSGPLLIVFQDAAEYRRFVPRHARQLNVQVNAPDSTGFTLQGVSSSSWDTELGSLRPVFAHEFLHGYLCHATRFPCHGEWLHEGLATYFQLKFHPQANLDRLVQDGISSSKKHAALSELCNGHRIALTQYWQAGTLWQMLFSEPRYQSQLVALFQRLEAAGSTDLAPHLEPVWQTDWAKLTADWQAFCERQFPKK